MSTHGEKLVGDLAKKLPSNLYRTIEEPRIVSGRSAYQNPDFVIVGAMLGVVVLEVKDWKFIRKIKRDSFEIQRTNGEIAQETNPLKIAREYALNLNDRFEKFDDLMKTYRGKRKLKFPWINAVALPHIPTELIHEWEKSELWQTGQILGKEDLLTTETFETAIRKLPSPFKLEKPLDEPTLNLIRSVIDPEIIVSDQNNKPIGVLTVQQERIIKEPLKVVTKPTATQPLLPIELLSEETQNIAENASVRLVRGVAGSGKSLVLVQRALHLGSAFPDMPMLIVAFNVDLVADLKKRMSKENISSNPDIINFHKLCSQILGSRWKSPINTEDYLVNNLSGTLIQSGFTAEFLADEIEWRKEFDVYDDKAYLEVERKGRGSALTREKRKIINEVFNKYIAMQKQQGFIDWSDVPFLALRELERPNHPMQKRYSVILIDEAQDFAPSWLQVITKILKPDGLLFMCDDPTQSIFRSYSWRDKGIEVVGRTRHLRVPFRSTLEISLAAHSMLGTNKKENESDELIRPDFSTYNLPSGDLPRLIKALNIKNEINLVEETAIKALSSLDSDQSEQVAILCHNKKFISSWAHLRQRGIYVNSFNKMKGLEFKTVIIPHINLLFAHPEYNGNDEYIEQQKRRMFTAMTRARENLILTYNSSLPDQLSPCLPYLNQQ